MQLRQLVNHLRYREIINFRDVPVTGITCDSRRVMGGVMFVAVSGGREDGARYAASALRRGAVAVVSEGRLPVNGDTVQIIVDDARKALSSLAAVLYDHPSTSLNVIGVTGTNGKTTTTYLVRSIMRAAGKGCGVIGTIEYNLGGIILPAGNTTPDAADLQAFLAQMVEHGQEFCAMEVSSHSLVQDRVADVHFDTAVFTNLSHEHLDYHLTLEEYFSAKALLFEMLNDSSRAVLNADDPRSVALARRTRAQVVWYGMDRGADIGAKILSSGIDGTRLMLGLPQGEFETKLRLVGKHNVSNALAAAAACGVYGVKPEHIVRGLESVAGLPGRLERVDTGGGFAVFVDYAHTDDALNTVLSNLRELAPRRIITVFGCGGDRDRAKRPKMAAASERWSDLTVVTSDNPRSEDPQAIIGDITRGFSREAEYVVQPDRAAAIEKAVTLAEAGDLVLIAGKGHETTQKFADRVVPFDDREVARKAIERRAGASSKSGNAITQKTAVGF
ncbi:MAG: UDP-N-acetylmuramoyl-L-alanyl-D-glutamate--2,6-diaminopimelate ligase [Planctomycetota bacterium]|nr:MAG: UDP-N-acetylmuramoyl-L-alanyl-D-glutamate--2,6-diaminopimelate ligase [Planctomycetota bacterium]